MDKLKPLGNLDLISVFESEAICIMNAASEGTILHNAKNIRDSGEPVEAALINLFSRRLPRTYGSISGYFYSEESKCSPQIDVMISQASEVHGLGPGSHGSEFVPLTSARVIGEVKNLLIVSQLPLSKYQI